MPSGRACRVIEDHFVQYRRQPPLAASALAGGTKRVKHVRSALASHRPTITGRTRGIQGVRHGVFSANIRCISTHRWTASPATLPHFRPWLTAGSLGLLGSGGVIGLGARLGCDVPDEEETRSGEITTEGIATLERVFGVQDLLFATGLHGQALPRRAGGIQVKPS